MFRNWDYMNEILDVKLLVFNGIGKSTRDFLSETDQGCQNTKKE